MCFICCANKSRRPIHLFRAFQFPVFLFFSPSAVQNNVFHVRLILDTRHIGVLTFPFFDGDDRFILIVCRFAYELKINQATSDHSKRKRDKAITIIAIYSLIS